MMWTSHDTVGFVFLAGFCVQFGFSFEGKTLVVSGFFSSFFLTGCLVLKVRSAKGTAEETTVIKWMLMRNGKRG